MKIKTSELQGAALDWAVAKCEGFKPHASVSIVIMKTYSPTTSWAQAGPIIEREIFKLFRNVGGTWTAQIKRRAHYYSPTYGADIGRDEILSSAGPAPLIAAMRCYVTSKMGDEIEVPDELSCP